MTDMNENSHYLAYCGLGYFRSGFIFAEFAQNVIAWN